MQDYAFHTLDGSALSLRDLHGKVVVVSFWASWCAPCRRELPQLEQLHRRIVEQGGSVLAISIDEDRENVKHFALKHALHLPIAHDGPNGLVRQLDLRHIPLTLVLDRNGRIVFSSGATDEAGMTALTAATNDVLAGHTASTLEGIRR